MSEDTSRATILNVAAELARKAWWADEYNEEVGDFMRLQARRLYAALGPIAKSKT